MAFPSDSWSCFFSLDINDRRIFILDEEERIDRLNPEFLDWMDLFVGPYKEAGSDYIKGPGWHYEEISTDGILDLNLSFEDPKHAAMFKLIWGYDSL